ncbi:hypothetical protein SEVIR_8G051700v4 [Setaria viridis]
MALSATLLKSSFLPKTAEWGTTRQAAAPKPVTVSMVVRASAYADELVQTAKTIASPGRGILAMDESNATCGKRLDSIGLENTEANRQAYRTLLVSAPGLGQYISGAILFEETLYQSTVDGKKITDVLVEQNIVPGIKVDKGLVPLAGSNNESFYYLAENNVIFEGILLKPSMVTPGAECKDRATPQQVADYTLKLLRRRIPPAVPGIMFLSGGQSEVEATQNLNAMNQSPNPWHVSFSYARALQNTCLKTWGGRPENVKAAQDALLLRAKANSLAQLGKYTSDGEAAEAKEGMFVKNYVY